MGNHGSANALLGTIFMSGKSLNTRYIPFVFKSIDPCPARTAYDKAPASVLQSRIFSQAGDAEETLRCLVQCLHDLKVPFDENPSWEKCDAEFEKLVSRITSMERNALINPLNMDDPNLASIGAVLADAISAAWWSDCLMYYHLSIIMVGIHLDSGAFPNSGMAFLHVAIAALARFSKAKLAADLGSIALDLLEKYRDPFSMARSYMLYYYLVAPAQMPFSVAVSQMETAVEYASAAGDRTSTILSFGLLVQLKLFASENCADLEALCQYGCEDIPNWQQDTRGGTLLIAVRQVCRALQGKTRMTIAEQVMDDSQNCHNSVAYKAWLDANTKNGQRSVLWYETLEIIPLFMFGHYDRAVEIGKRCVASGKLLWSGELSSPIRCDELLSLGHISLQTEYSECP